MKITHVSNGTMARSLLEINVTVSFMFSEEPIVWAISCRAKTSRCASVIDLKPRLLSGEPSVSEASPASGLAEVSKSMFSDGTCS